MNNSKNNSVIEVTPIAPSKRQFGKMEQILSYLPFIKKNNPIIAVLRLSGVIGKVSMKPGLTLEGVGDLIEKAFEFPRLKAVCLCINSPGGSPVQSELIADRIISLSLEKKIPVYSFVEDVAASGGYWLACAGKEIYASESSIIGSIGVISQGFGFQEAIQKLGIERRVYSQGKNKSVLDPFKEAKEEDITIIKKLQKQIHNHFIDYVKTRRIGRLTQDDDILFNGEFWAGQTAVDYGLIDGITNLHKFIKSNFGEEATIEYVSPKQSWLKKRLGMVSAEFASNLSSSITEDIKENLIKNKYNLF